MDVLQTQRLNLRWLRDDDAPFMLGLLNQPSFIANIGDRGVRTVEAARQYIEDRVVASYREHGYGMYLVERLDDREPVGLCGLVRRAFLEHADVGFAFLPQFWSQGYAFESAAAVMQYSRERLGLTRIVAIVSPHNEPSMRLLRKIGLDYERLITLPDSGDECALFVPAAG